MRPGRALRTTTTSGSCCSTGTSSMPAAPAASWTRRSARSTGSRQECVRRRATRRTRAGASAGCGDIEEELTVSFRAWERGVGHAEDAPTPGRHLRLHLREHAAAHVGIADDPSPADVRGAGLELGLHEHERAPARRRAGQGGRQRLAEADEGHVARDEGGREREVVTAEVTHVRPLENGDARVVAQARMKLAVADVEGADAVGARLEQAVREPAGGGADVEAVFAGDVDLELGERAGELLASARDEARRGFGPEGGRGGPPPPRPPVAPYGAGE